MIIDENLWDLRPTLIGLNVGVDEVEIEGVDEVEDVPDNGTVIGENDNILGLSLVGYAITPLRR